MSAQESEVDPLDPLAVPLRACEPWCDRKGDGHPDQHPEDRLCWSRFWQTPLSLGKADKYGDVWRLDCLEVVLRRWPRASEASVLLHRESTDIEIELTLHEARTLRAHLDAALSTAEPDA
ncbi:MAG: hypothetical protein ACR2K3_07125 [Nocardioides sp.]